MEQDAAENIDAKALFRLKRGVGLKESDAGATKVGSGGKADGKLRVDELAQRITEMQDILYAGREHKVLVVLQGMDTSGKDGTVRGVFGKIDPLGIRSVAFGKPAPDELNHDFLRRVHRHVPGRGMVAIFNRSHYEDVLITRVHDWIDEAECQRRLAHIRDFERLLSETGTVVLKFFLHISKDEQKKRLMKRLENPDKHWKFDPQDLEERKLWTRYQATYRHAIEETDTDHAPWYIIPADSKTHRNLAIASVVCETLEDLQLAYPPPRLEYARLLVE
jgi:PPK2 family polyphosphate:nucleotide phosphotransferase